MRLVTGSAFTTLSRVVALVLVIPSLTPQLRNPPLLGAPPAVILARVQALIPFTTTWTTATTGW